MVLPTFNEAGQIVPAIEDVEQALRGTAFEVLVIDDDSPDGTSKVVEDYARSRPWVRLHTRVGERGLAAAELEGLKRARGAYAVIMDADGQHPASVLPRMLERAETAKADLVVASRYAAGGSEGAFPFHRRVISGGARTLAKVAMPRLRRAHITDPMSGCFMVRQGVPLDRLRPRGYKLLIELVGRVPGLRVEEVGYVFDTRRGGESKLRLSTDLDYLVHLAILAAADPVNWIVLLVALVSVSAGAVVWSLR